MKSKKYGDSTVAERLRVARARAGFTSSQVAATSFGWPVARYRAQESGTRKSTGDDLAAFSKAFNVTKDWLLGKGNLGPDPGASREPDRNRMRTANRLALARVLAGFKTGHAAADFYDWRRSTYSAHENAQNALSEDAAHVYGLAYGVTERWLLSGKGSSRLPAIPIGLLQRAIRDDHAPSTNDPALVESLNHYAKENRRETRQAIRGLGSRLKASEGIDRRKSVPIAEVTWSQAKKLMAGNTGATRSHDNVWSFPKALLPARRGIGERAFIVINALAERQDKPQRVLVDVFDNKPKSGTTYVVWTENTFRIQQGQIEGADVLGRVLAIVNFF